MEAPDGRAEQRRHPAASETQPEHRRPSAGRHVSFQPTPAGHPAPPLHAAQSQGPASEPWGSFFSL